MFERFDAEARRATVLANEWARQMDHNFIGTEHFLIGVLSVMENEWAIATHALLHLRDKEVTVERARDAVVERVGLGVDASVGHPSFTDNVRRLFNSLILEQSIGLDQLLAAIVRFDYQDTQVPCVGQLILQDLGIDLAELSGLLPRAEPLLRVVIIAAGYGDEYEDADEMRQLQIEHEVLEKVLFQLQREQARVEARLAELAEARADEAPADAEGATV